MPLFDDKDEKKSFKKGKKEEGGSENLLVTISKKGREKKNFKKKYNILKFNSRKIFINFLN